MKEKMKGQIGWESEEGGKGYKNTQLSSEKDAGDEQIIGPAKLLFWTNRRQAPPI